MQVLYNIYKTMYSSFLHEGIEGKSEQSLEIDRFLFCGVCGAL